MVKGISIFSGAGGLDVVREGQRAQQIDAEGIGQHVGHRKPCGEGILYLDAIAGKAANVAAAVIRIHPGAASAHDQVACFVRMRDRRHAQKGGEADGRDESGDWVLRIHGLTFRCVGSRVPGLHAHQSRSRG